MKILFICKNNQFRSQMAAAIYNKLTASNDASSAGTYVGAPDAPEDATIETFFRTPDFFELMEEHGMHIRDKRMTKLSSSMLDDADIIISMAEEPFIPEFLRDSKKVIIWNIENPPFATREISEKTYAEIHPLVEALQTNMRARV